MKFFKNKKGFTLVELVVVIAILGILAGIAIPRFMDATASARGAKLVADMRTIDAAIVMYQAKNGTLPTDNSGSELTDGKYLASWPFPPTGATKITNDKGKTASYTPAENAIYSVDITNGNAVLGATAGSGDSLSTILATDAD